MVEYTRCGYYISIPVLHGLSPGSGQIGCCRAAEKVKKKNKQGEEGWRLTSEVTWHRRMFSLPFSGVGLRVRDEAKGHGYFGVQP